MDNLKQKYGTVYLSGPMTGQKNLGKKNFADAEATVRALGLDVINPREKDLPEGVDYPIVKRKKLAEILLTDLHLLLKADTICLLPNWETSLGASLEKQFATIAGLNIIGLEALEYELEQLNKAKNQESSLEYIKDDTASE